MTVLQPGEDDGAARTHRLERIVDDRGGAGRDVDHPVDAFPTGELHDRGGNIHLVRPQGRRGPHVAGEIELASVPSEAGHDDLVGAGALALTCGSHAFASLRRMRFMPRPATLYQTVTLTLTLCALGLYNLPDGQSHVLRHLLPPSQRRVTAESALVGWEDLGDAWSRDGNAAFLLKLLALSGGLAYLVKYAPALLLSLKGLEVPDEVISAAALAVIVVPTGLNCWKWQQRSAEGAEFVGDF